MDMSNLSLLNSPKRKRGNPTISTIPPTPPASSPAPESYPPALDTSFTSGLRPDDDLPGSPRTKVTYNFQGLRLEDASAVARFELDGPRKSSLAPRDEYADEDPNNEEEEIIRKRVKMLRQKRGPSMEIPETPDVGKARDREKQFNVYFGPERMIDPVVGDIAKDVVLSNEIDPVIFKGSPVARVKGAGLARAYPSINRLQDSKSRAPKKRMGSPALSADNDTQMVGDHISPVVDPERSALTWHDDEITGHIPDDPDDDGEGINGIGFKPTAAEAYTRAHKRKQQMSEYRNREAREARKARGERRRAGEDKVTREEAETAKRVRFMEAEVKSVITT